MKTSLYIITALLLTSTIFANTSQEDQIKKMAEEAALKIAQDQKKIDKKKQTRAEIENRPAVLKKTGGFIDVEAVGISVIVVDTREKPGVAADRFAEVFGNLSKTNVKIDKSKLGGSEKPYTKALSALKVNKASFALLITEGCECPGLCVMPEDRIAIINASRYLGGNDPLAPETRLIKELWRSLGFVSGIGYAPYTNDVLQPVYNLKELDALVYQVMQPMNFQKMYAQMAKFGVKRARHIPYSLAVREGWAPQPTNEYQKAIWDKLHAAPKNPMKIQYDPKKGR